MVMVIGEIRPLAFAGRDQPVPLAALRLWLATENTAIMAVVLLVIGITLTGKGIAGF